MSTLVEKSAYYFPNTLEVSELCSICWHFLSV